MTTKNDSRPGEKIVHPKTLPDFPNMIRVLRSLEIVLDNARLWKIAEGLSPDALYEASSQCRTLSVNSEGLARDFDRLRQQLLDTLGRKLRSKGVAEAERI